MLHQIKLWVSQLLVVTLIPTSVLSQDPNRWLKQADIDSVMSKMMEVHVETQEVTVSLLKRAVWNYFEQFDPDHMYLLKGEVTAITEVPDRIWMQRVAQVQKGDYKLFEVLNQEIQKAIWRARLWRGQMKNPNGSINISEVKGVEGKLTLKDLAEAEYGFAKDLDELKERWRKFIAYERSFEKYDEEMMLAYLKEHEDDYLYVDDNGAPMKPKEQEHTETVLILKALAGGLDSHSYFFSPQEIKSLKRDLEQAYVGVGIWFNPKGDQLFVRELIQGGPAKKVGLIEPGDQLIMVNGELVERLGVKEAFKRIEGKKGSSVQLSFRREGGQFEDYSVNLIREQIVLSDRVEVDSRPYKGGIIAHVTLKSFYESELGHSSEGDIKAAIETLREKGKIEGLILDLRDNSGGYLSQAVRVAGLFISNGVVAISKYSDGSVNYYRDLDPSIWYDGPIVVLTSRLSASASEIVAQTLQDYGLGIVVGDGATYGKGSIQHHNLSESRSDAFYKVTVGKYYTVSGRTTQLEGVHMDIVVPGPFGDETIGERFTDYPLGNDEISSVYKDSLLDVPVSEKMWFIRNYLPTLQQPSLKWKAFLPMLRRNSNRRVNHYFAKKAYEDRKDVELEALQVDEAYMILKEMINTQVAQR